MKTVDFRKTLTIALALAAMAGAQGVWTGERDISWFKGKESSKSFTISTAEQLAGLAQIINEEKDANGRPYTMSGKTITLDRDIALNDREGGANIWTPIGTDFDRSFRGTFNGAGFVIRGVYIDDKDSGDYRGLFGYVFNGTIKNVRIAESDIKGGRYVGGLAGFDSGSANNLMTITGCSVTGSVSGSVYVGGLVGYNRGTITNSYKTGTVTGTKEYVGGLAGWNAGAITNSYAAGRNNKLLRDRRGFRSRRGYRRRVGG